MAPDGVGRDRVDQARADHDRLAARARALFVARLAFVLVGAAPFALTLLAKTLPAGALRELVKLPFALVCHQRLERTLELAGAPMPVCSRCAGIFAGLALGAVALWPRLSLRAARLALFGAGAAMALDVALQDLGLHPLWHATRLATGFALGGLGAAALFSAIRREAVTTQPA